MSELLENEDLNEMVEEEIDDASVVTVPIDETLTRHGEAADAKAVGDALATKANKSEVLSNITVNGKERDQSGNIEVEAEDIPYSNNKTVKEKIDDVDGKTAEDIPMSEGVNPQTVAEAISNASARTAEQIPMETGSIKTISAKIGEIDSILSTMQDEIEQGGEELMDAEIHAIVNQVFGN